VNDSDKWSPRLVALALLGCLLFNYPILALFNVPGAIAGIPVLYAYIFSVWAVFIAMIALIVRSGG
jgi:ABC-type amino acid transport system permease subunit